MSNPFNAEATLSTAAGEFKYFSLQKLADDGVGEISTLPYSIRILLEACLRNVDGFIVSEDDVRGLANWKAEAAERAELPFKPGRVCCKTSPAYRPSSISRLCVKR